MNKEKFEEYKRIRDTGITNMFHIKNVVKLSGGDLNRKDCLDIMENFDKYEEGIFNG